MDLEKSQLQSDNIVKWQKYIPINDFTGGHKILEKQGMISKDNPKKYHLHKGFNKFTKETYPIPESDNGWIHIEEIWKKYYDEQSDGNLTEFLSNNWQWYKKYIARHICDPHAKIFSPQMPHPMDKHKGYNIYKTLDNGATSYFVLVKNNHVLVYGMTMDVILKSSKLDEKEYFIDLVKEYEPLEIFIGKSPLNKMTDFSGGHGDKWNGNSILLRIGPQKYTYIGESIYEFKTDEPILKYTSSVGNNCIPYPYAESSLWCYAIELDKISRTPISQHPNREYEGYVHYVKNVTYEEIPIDTIQKRAIDLRHYEILPNSDDDTNRIIFDHPIEVKHMENTCRLHK